MIKYTLLLMLVFGGCDIDVDGRSWDISSLDIGIRYIVVDTWEFVQDNWDNITNIIGEEIDGRTN